MFGERLKDLRNQKGYSMDKLIEIYNRKYNAKMNKSTLSRYENGIQEPIYTVVVNFANFFDVSVDYLSGGEYQPAAETFSNEKGDAIGDIVLKLRTDNNYLKVCSKLLDLSEEQLEAVQMFLSAFK